MSYTDLRDFDPEYTEVFGDLKIQIEKLGGGTVGQKYEGIWRYVVTDDATGEEIERGQDLRTGTPKTHHDAARILAAFLAGES